MHASHSRYVYGLRGLMKRSETLMQSAVTTEAQALDEVIRALQDSKGRSPEIIYSEFGVFLSRHDRRFVPTLWHPER